MFDAAVSVAGASWVATRAVWAGAVATRSVGTVRVCASCGIGCDGGVDTTGAAIVGVACAAV